MSFQIFIADITALENPDVFAAGMNYVSKRRREQVDKIRPRDSKERSLAAGILFEYACSINNIPHECRSWVLSASGKPSFADGNGRYFNLSHSGKRAMCAFASAPVGCDVEQTGRFNEKFIRRFFAGDEILYLQGVAPQNLNDECTRIWTLRESYMKCDGRGISMDPSSFSVVDKEGKICLIADGLTCRVNRECRLYNLANENGYSYSCAVADAGEGENRTPVVEWVDIAEILKHCI